MSLTKKALLANLRISQWTGRKYDKRANDTVETKHNTQGRVGNYTKKLLPGAETLENVRRLADSIRKFFYEQSLPWFSDGSRIVAAQNYLDFVNEFRTRKAEFDNAVSDFLAEYHSLKSEAHASLGDLYNDAEYPNYDYLKETFSCEITFLPIPDAGDFRVEILDSEKETFLKNMARVEQDAARECWERLYKVVNKAAERIADPKAILRDSLLENVHEICALLPKLNVTDDPDLESMRIAVKKTVNSISTDDCRKVTSVREDAARVLANITDKMGAFMGAPAPVSGPSSGADSRNDGPSDYSTMANMS